MHGPSLRLQAACPCCGQALRHGWRLEQRWGRFVEFAGPGKITPVGIVPLDAPPALVREAAWVAKWATAPEAVVTSVCGAADTLLRAGWPPSTPWPTTWPR